MTDKTVIISMTSYPARIKSVGLVWYSIISQITASMDVHCVLVLAKPEFPLLDKSLPEDLQLLIEHNYIEVIWCEHNTKSHKKLMPTLTKYPDNPILVIDDDQLRTSDWLSNFLSDHYKYPNDVLAGIIHFRLVGKTFKYKTISNNERGQIIQNGRSANGRGGTLYPAHTFTHPAFFDENLYMKLSPTSDESWQFYFLHNAGIHPRALTKYTSDKHLVVTESNDLPTALWNVNKGKYDVIYDTIASYFNRT